MRRILFATLMLAALFGASLQASPVLTGQFNIGGQITVANPGVTTTGTGSLAGLTCPAGTQCIFWANTPDTQRNKADISGGMTAANGVFFTLDTPPGTFSGDNKANIFDMFNPPAVVGAPYPPQLFMSFNTAGVTTTLNGNFIPPGVFSPAQCSTNPAAYVPGQVCTPPGSLFSFVNGFNGTSTVGWTFNGVTNNDGPPGPNGQSSWVATFSAQFPVSYQQVLLDLQNNGFVNNTYSATIKFTATGVPEAGTMSMLGLGLVLFSTVLRRKARKN